MSTSDTDTYTVSFKSGEHYGASLLVVRGDSVPELLENLDGLDDVLTKMVETEASLVALRGLGGPKPSSADSGATTAQSGGEVRMCAHGQRNRREGTSSKGKWVGWFCALPKGSQGACKAEFEDVK